MSHRARMMAAIAAGSALVATACQDAVAPLEPATYTFSFEHGLEGWTPRAMDLDLGNDTIDWSIETSTDLARHGTRSLRLFLANWNDAGKIWAEQAFSLRPAWRYRVTVSYDFATSDPGEMVLFRIITGVLPSSPRQVQDLLPTFQGDTGTGLDEPVGYRWVDHAYDFELDTGRDGLAHVLIGVWGTWETPRTYYADHVRVAFQPLR